MENMNINCLFELFKQIKILCETEHCNSDEVSIKYSNLIQFVVSNEWIRKQFRHWDEQLYSDLAIHEYEEKQKEICVLFAAIYAAVHNFTQREKEAVFTFWINKIKEKIYLEKIILRYTTNIHYDYHMEFFDDILRAMEKKPFIKHLVIDMKDYTMPHLSKFRNLRTLTLNVKIDDMEDLVELVKSSPDLRQLNVWNNEIRGRLSDITLGGNTLQNLKTFGFLMKLDVDAVQYANFGKLPKLERLNIKGEHEIGSLKHLFNCFAKQSIKNLRHLILNDADLNDEEIQIISQIKSIEKLMCGFVQPESIAQLSQIDQLTKLIILSEHEVSELLPHILYILMSTKCPQIFVSFHQGSMHYFRSKEYLLWVIKPFVINASEYASLGQFTNLRNLEIAAKNLRSGSLQNIFKEFANRVPQTLEQLKMTNKMLTDIDFCDSKSKMGLNSNEIIQIASIKSLKSVDCVFSEMVNIEVLGHLPELEELSINVPSRLINYDTKGIENLIRLLACKHNSTLKFLNISKLPIGLPLTMQLSDIKSLRTLKCTFTDNRSIECLSGLYNLEDVEIKSKEELHGICDIILQIISTTNISFKIKNAVSIKSFNGETEIELFLHNQKSVTHLAPLGKVQKCHSFVVSNVNIKNINLLLHYLPYNENLKILHLGTFAINYEDSLLVRNIKKLEKLICGFSDPKCFEVIFSNTKLKKIHITDNEFSPQIFHFLAKSNGEVIIDNSLRRIKYYKNQEKLILENQSWHRFIYDASDYGFLGKLKNVRTLHIIGDNEEGTLTNLFLNLALTGSLEELIIEQSIDKNIDEDENIANTIVTINSQEVLQVAKIETLKRLKCGFLNTKNIETLAQLKNLEELTITKIEPGSLQILFKEFSNQSLSDLRYVSIESQEINNDDLRAIASKKLLKTLKCTINNINNNNDNFPELPNLTDLCIRSQSESRVSNQLSLFTNSPLQNVEILGDPLDDQDMLALAEYKLLKSLHFNFRQLQSENNLFAFNELEELYIKFNDEFYFMEIPLNFFTFSPNIRKLVLRNITIKCTDITNILKLTALRSLDCSLDIKENTNLDRLAKLEELIITPQEDSLKIILQFLTANGSASLKHLVIYESHLDMEDSLQLSNMISLLRLECRFLYDDSLHHLTKLKNLEILTITDLVNRKDISNYLLDIMKNCTKLQTIDFSDCEADISWDFFYKTLDLLKSFRNPDEENPLHMGVPSGPNMHKYNLLSGEQQYLKILQF
ncbi:uncharacterized protein LOC111518597 [Drosophila willistoni]|uniref:uncharacterized protein LOC111518597 n=1 Tax=Drosophila willistoni TaxID=7260 RepID=UPI001F079E01|nr:uncharacterized protein LOC111518597 [Drosophila willistoni]